jgi:hypothetical protein
MALQLPVDVYLEEHWLRRLRDQWLFASSGLCSAWVSPLLDELLDDDSKAAVIVDVANRTIEKLRVFGDIVPANFLNLLSVSDPFRDLPVEWFEEIYTTFNSLLRRTLETNASNSPALPRV